MEPSEFSETTYAVCLMHEMINAWGIANFPVFPSTVAEGQEGGGYDATFDRPAGGVVFVQFKIPMLLDHHRSGEAGTLGLPYFRFKLPKRRSTQPKSQHQMLREQEAHSGSIVFYASPRFNTSLELQAAFETGQLLSRSFTPAPSELGDLDPTEEHAVNYQPAGDLRVVRSEPRVLLESLSLGQLTESGFEGVGPVRRVRGASEFEAMAEDIIERSSVSNLPDLAGGLDQRRGFLRLQYVARLLLAAEVLPLPLPRASAAAR